MTAGTTSASPAATASPWPPPAATRCCTAGSTRTSGVGYKTLITPSLSPQPGGELGLCGDDGEVRPPVLALPPLGPGSGHQNCSADAAQPAPARTGGHRQHQLCVRYFLDILRYFLDI